MNMNIPTPRPRNPRRVALELLRMIKKNTTTMVVSWDESQKVAEHRTEPNPFAGQTYYGAPAPATVVRTTWRKRRPDEQIENSVEQWRRLEQFMLTIISQADDMATYARQQQRRLAEMERDSA